MLVKSSEFRDAVLNVIDKMPHKMGPLLKQWQEAHTEATKVVADEIKVAKEEAAEEEAAQKAVRKA